jgi:hypothetical protein
MKTRGDTRHPQLGIMAISLLFLTASPATGIDFSPLPLAFVENFTGETSTPTTPEIDLLGTSGLTVDGTFSGSAAQLSIDDVDIDSLTLFSLVDTTSVSTHGSSHGLRAEFENLALASDGSANLRIGASLQPVGPGTVSQIQVLLILVQDAGAGDFAFLRIHELDPDDLSNPIGESSVQLLASEATAILSGAHVRLDLFIDDSINIADAEIEIDGVPASAGTFLALADYTRQTLEFAFFGLTHFVNLSLTPPATVDVTLVEAYANVQPLSFVPLFNIDFSGATGTPPNSYAAAGGAGEWNRFLNLGGLLLVDVNNLVTGASATISSETINNFGGPLGGDADLLADSTSDCNDPDEWSLTFAGLTDGVYKIIAYAPISAAVQTGDISIDGSLAIDSLPGDSPAALVEGTSWDSTLAVVSGGTLSIDGLGNGAVSCAGIAGVQLEFGTPIVAAPSVPSLNVYAIVGLIGLLLFVGRLSLERRWMGAHA